MEALALLPMAMGGADALGIGAGAAGLGGSIMSGISGIGGLLGALGGATGPAAMGAAGPGVALDSIMPGIAGGLTGAAAPGAATVGSSAPGIFGALSGALGGGSGGHPLLNMLMQGASMVKGGGGGSAERQAPAMPLGAHPSQPFLTGPMPTAFQRMNPTGGQRSILSLIGSQAPVQLGA